MTASFREMPAFLEAILDQRCLQFAETQFQVRVSVGNGAHGASGPTELRKKSAASQTNPRFGDAAIITPRF